MRPPHRTGHGGDFEISVDSPRPRTACRRSFKFGIIKYEECFLHVHDTDCHSQLTVVDDTCALASVLQSH